MYTVVRIVNDLHVLIAPYYDYVYLTCDVDN